MNATTKTVCPCGRAKDDFALVCNSCLLALPREVYLGLADGNPDAEREAKAIAARRTEAKLIVV